MGTCFQSDCRACPRLADYLDSIRRQYPDYFTGPVPPFGAEKAELLIVGLAPGLHGANATGRPFTGDHAGILLYETLYRYGFSSAPASRAVNDGLTLLRCRITNAVKCVPPQNKPTGSEVAECNGFLAAELAEGTPARVLLALGRISHQAILRASGLKASAYTFAHGAEHTLPNGSTLIDSYHCSRYNTQTRRLTPEMFAAVFERARALLDEPS